jgi:HK97 family phage major capsid protein
MTELKTVLEAQAKAWEDYKQVNDQRLKAIEEKSGVGHLDAKLEKINATMEALAEQQKAIESKMARGAAVETKPANEHKSAFIDYVRKGVNEGGLRELERKNTVNIGTAADGGYALPEEIAMDVQARVQDISPVRSVATVVTCSTNDYKRLIDARGTASGWVAETDSRTTTNTPVLYEAAAFMGELYANPQATQQALEDIFFNVESWLAESVATEFARAEGAAFISGNGTSKPKGFTAYTIVSTDDATRTFGQLQYVPTGAAGDWASTNPADALITTVYKLKAAHRNGAVWMMSKSILAEIRKFKDDNGVYLLQPSLAAGTPTTLLGFPVVEAEDMAAKAANSYSIAFGNFRAGYCVVDRVGTSLIRDPFSNKPYIGFYTRKRVGGMLLDSEAIKLVKFAAS